MEQIVPPRTSVATAGERVQLLKIFKGPCQHHLIFPLFWLKPCEGTGFSNLPPRVYELSQEEVAIPKCQMLFFGETLVICSLPCARPKCQIYIFTYSAAI